MPSIARHSRQLAVLAAGSALALVVVAVPVLGQGGPGRSAAAPAPAASEKPKPSKGPKAEKVPETPVTLTGHRRDAHGRRGQHRLHADRRHDGPRPRGRSFLVLGRREPAQAVRRQDRQGRGRAGDRIHRDRCQDRRRHRDPRRGQAPVGGRLEGRRREAPRLGAVEGRQARRQGRGEGCRRSRATGLGGPEVAGALPRRLIGPHASSQPDCHFTDTCPQPSVSVD